MMRYQIPIAALALAVCLPGQDLPPKKQKFVETKTETLDLPANGLLRLKHSIGDVAIEAWDQPQVELTTTKSSHEEYPAVERAKATAFLDKVKVTTERHGDELVVTTDFPRHRGWPPPLPWYRTDDFDMEYHISVPRNARLAIDHDVGSVNVDGVAGNIDARVLQGEIMLHLAEDVPYSIDAKSEYGNVNSDFPGERRRRWIGQSAFFAAPPAAAKLHLRIGYGDIVLLRIRIPKSPPPAPTAYGTEK